jgi:hypothetical protein
VAGGRNRSGTTRVVGALRRLGTPVFLALPPGVQRAALHARGRYAPWEDGFDFTPPHLQSGEIGGAPDFVGIGAQKAGTTWWYGLIASHPGVATRPNLHKERHFFDRYAARAFGPDDAACYRAWFPRPPAMVTGEWTPDYMHLPWVPGLLAQAAPEARLLVLLRDPVERLRSGLAHDRRYRKASAEASAAAVARGFYDEALARWTAHFDPRQFLFLQYERCVADPRSQLARTYEFLDLEPFTPKQIERRVSETRHAIDLEPGTRHRLAELYAPDVLALTTKYPDLDLDLSLWPNFTALVGH